MAEDINLSPAEVSLVLKRAAELDAHGPAISADELVAIAAEAGFDRVAGFSRCFDSYSEGRSKAS